MEWYFVVILVSALFGLFSYLNREKITESFHRSLDSSDPKEIEPKPMTEQQAMDDWVKAFKGEPTTGSHRITETYYSKRVMKDGSKWPSYKSDNWPVWKCACGADGTVVMRDHDYAAAEKRAVEEATRHVNDNNYVEWKNKNRLDGRAF